MAKYIIHKSFTRGHANYGWLDTNYTFSFAGYYNSERMNFGALRVLNDDIIAPEAGFGTHPHDNMEIISIPIEGVLKHKDSMGNEISITDKEIQVMSAGTGIQHSEFNGLSDKEAKFLQIWIYPEKINIEPRYQQERVLENLNNELKQIVSPIGKDSKMQINQNAYIYYGRFSERFNETLKSKVEDSGFYLFLISGEIEVGGYKLEARDGIGVIETTEITVTGENGADFIIIEIPMKIK